MSEEDQQINMEELDELDAELEEAEDDDEKITIYEDFIAFEKEMAVKSNTYERVNLVFERAVADFPSSEDLWMQYTMWLESQNLNSLDVHQRACEACSNSTDLWQRHLLALERVGASYEDFLKKWEHIETIISNEADCVFLYRSFVYITHRYLVKNGINDLSLVENLFLEARKTLREKFVGDSDDATKFYKNYAFYLYSKAKKPEEARAVWNDLFSKYSWMNTAENWLEFIKDERFYGDVTHARAHFYTAINRVPKFNIFESFLQFEREEGTQDQLNQALDVVNSKARQIKNTPQAHSKNAKANSKKFNKFAPKKSVDNTHKSTVANADRKRTANELALQSPLKKPNVEEPKQNRNNDIDEHGFKRPLLPPSRKDIKKAVERSGDDVEMQKLVGDVGPSEKSIPLSFHYSTGMESNKLFVRNVHFACTAEELKSHFSRYGEVESVRIVTHKDGKPKGVAYVDFINEEEAQKGLRADGSKLRDRKIKAFISNPPSKSEKNKEEKSIESRETPSSYVNSASEELSVLSRRVPRAGQLFLPRSISKISTRNNTTNGN